MDIKAYKLKSGEEIVAEETDRTGKTVFIKNPITLVRLAPEAPPSMVSWFQVGTGSCEGNEQSNRNFELDRDNILLDSPAIQNVSEVYEQQFGAGILKPTQKIITSVN